LIGEYGYGKKTRIDFGITVIGHIGHPLVRPRQGEEGMDFAGSLGPVLWRCQELNWR